MRRYLEESIKRDLREKIVLLSGPRQVGKTTVSKQLTESFVYLSYDAAADRRLIAGEAWDKTAELVVFDELHKMKKWKTWLKGLYDTRGVPPGILVTGSARLDVLRKGGDSLAGRFHSYRLHPFTVKELAAPSGETPRAILDRILATGGFPEPYLKGAEIDAARWRRSHIDSIIRQDLLDLENVRDLKSIEILIDLLRARVGAPTSFASLAGDLQISIPTVRRRLEILENLCLIFPVRPYHRNIARAILKEPKYFFYDTGSVEGDRSARLENAVACALLRELHLLEDTTGARVGLHYLRDKEKREVDFLAVVNHRPVLMVEVKIGDDSFARPLFRFREALPGTRAVQVVDGLERRKEKDGVEMRPAAEFLATLEIRADHGSTLNIIPSRKKPG
jgi:predicted AAA+ superfamily ATPase